jgi:hypothetical protein
VKTPGSLRPLVPPALLIAVICVLYFPLLQFPFVQDDWGLLHNFGFHSAMPALAGVFNPAGQIFYRPLAFVYCAVVYYVFGLNPLGFHILALLLLIASSLLVVSTTRWITGEDVLAWGTGFLFAGAATVHIDLQMWLVGIFDIGACIFALLSILLFIRGRTVASAITMALALGFKESAASIPAILVALWLFKPHEDTMSRKTWQAAWTSFRIHVIIVAGYLVIKAQGTSLFSLPEHHPYAARLFGPELWQNALLYTGWMVEAITPIKSLFHSRPVPLLVPAAASLVAAISYIVTVVGRSKRKIFKGQTVRRGLFVIAWLILTLTPPVALIHHPNKYYLADVVAPLALLFLGGLTAMIRSYARNRRVEILVLVLLLGINLIDSGLLVWKKAGLGLHEGIHASSLDGDNHLIRKASLVRLVWASVMQYYPSLPKGAAVAMENVDIGTFNGAAGPQLWYRDSTLLVSEVPPALVSNGDSATLVLAPTNYWNPSQIPRIATVLTDRVFCIRRVGDSVEVVTKEEKLRKEAGSDTRP